MTRVRVLTPAGTGAIATVEVSGPRAWELARQLFRPAGKPLPDAPELYRFWFGTLGGDEVILAVTGPETIEVHCHGGVRVVRMVVEQFAARGCVEGGRGGGFATPREGAHRGVEDSAPATLLQRAPTLRTAAILLDQFHGAFDREIGRILDLLEPHVGHSPTYEEARRELGELARRAPVGRHLVEPWRVVVAGPPNVGKSSLVNALAGYQRAVVSDVAGTTRDVVSVPVAFDGWPVEIIDTAGLREAEGLEAEGVERARRVLTTADLVVWLIDGTEPRTVWPESGTDVPEDRTVILVQSKADLPIHPTQDPAIRDTTPVSTVTGEGIAALIGIIVKQFILEPPPPGSAVPYTPGLVDLVAGAHKALEGEQVEEARRLLGECHSPS